MVLVAICWVLRVCSTLWGVLFTGMGSLEKGGRDTVVDLAGETADWYFGDGEGGIHGVAFLPGEGEMDTILPREDEVGRW